ncbi:RNA polymerase, sigma-24 subunit, ECF subfamily [Pseudopedobacter saltans DSM 12145]|uniref:RNA polymerase, sigma-24 subunit, ECF subfamily n=1 Tax=Pseudopedobacter saltans (strain ATCC 51119 / DSM 12145 / JCM 21818 / CCUG 39354 / LMG 10337 / NBRC 100064 / NCIMB 13643) TaxID=762903 RepID=F0SC67_PSESL|nr:RNA polymerase sigma-70 factor [Pseudopedobacter saltans]ADY50652.1 RNA polymerase, sigma-24 subunit, ECF subfamily [Pseudopedobacter saltans DSM 12145]
MDILGTFLGDKELNDQSTDVKGLFDKFYDRLVYFSFQIIKDQEYAEDVVQEAFVKLLNNKDILINSEPVLKSYLYNSVKNLSLNVLRRGKVAERYMQLTKTDDEPTTAPIVEAIISAEVFSQIHRALDELPEHYKQISFLSFFEGKKNQEVADELGMSINTLKKQKQKAIQMLRLKLTSFLSLILALFIFL